MPLENAFNWNKLQPGDSYRPIKQLKTLRKCRFRPSEGFVKPKIFLYAPRQPMVALRLDSPTAITHLQVKAGYGPAWSQTYSESLSGF